MKKILLLKGFTFTEVLIAVSIFATLATFSALFYSRFLTQNNVASVQETLFGTLRKAHTYSIMSRKSNTSGWGVHYDSATKKIIVFQGASYATRNTALDETNSLASNI